MNILAINIGNKVSNYKCVKKMNNLRWPVKTRLAWFPDVNRIIIFFLGHNQNMFWLTFLMKAVHRKCKKYNATNIVQLITLFCCRHYSVSLTLSVNIEIDIEENLSSTFKYLWIFFLYLIHWGYQLLNELF